MNCRRVKTLPALAMLLFAYASHGQHPAATFQHADWHARWIAAPWSTTRDGAEADGSRPMPIFRREFQVRPGLQKATLRIAGLGQWNASLDGRELIPGAGLHGSWTNYRKRVEFRTLDLTPQLTPGAHVLGVMLGNGMYNVQHTQGRYTKFEGSFGIPKLTAELILQYADGCSEILPTDSRWQTHRGPITFGSIYGGEDNDARLDPSGWNTTHCDTKDWDNAQIVDGPGGKLTEAIEPDVVASGEIYHPVHITQSVPGRTVYDLGQNFAGVVHIKVEGTSGARLKITPGELLNADGTVSQANSGRGMWWSYTLHSSNTEEWRPRFSYSGFRYIQAEWVGDTPPGHVLEITGEAIRSASAPAGTFSSSDDMFNHIHSLILHAMHNNEVSLLTDCPHREKLGWLEQTHLMAAGLMFNDDLEALYRETTRNMIEAQDASGMVPTIAPQYTQFGPRYAVYDDSPEWGSAIVLAPWAAFRFYGDKTELAALYPAMLRWVHYLASRADAQGIVSYGLGDWYDVGPGDPGFSKNTTAGITGTLMLYECAHTLAKIARLLGKNPVEAQKLDSVAQHTAAAFDTHFWDEANGWYDHGSQTANAMPLALDIVPQQRRARVLAHVIADIRAHNDHVTTGEVGFPYLLRALHAAGRDDVVFALLERPDPPSYGAQLAAGATALTEAWDANPHSSQDHFMLGGAEEWFYGMLAGIEVDMSRTQPEQRITIRPGELRNLENARATYRSHLGEITVARSGGNALQSFEITVPVRATVVLPLSFPGQQVFLEAGRHSRPVHALRADDSSATFVIPSGTTHFRLAPPVE